jgi:hypothetical protein
MPTTEPVTVTLPAEVIRDIDRMETNRSKFILDAVHHELQRRRREELELSLRQPHPESARVAEEGFDEWARACGQRHFYGPLPAGSLRAAKSDRLPPRSLPAEDASKLVDARAGTAVRWAPGKGWVEVTE